MKVPFITQLLLFATLFSFSQEKSEKDIAWDLAKKAAELGNNNQIDSSRYYYHLSIDAYQKLSTEKGDNWYREVLNLNEDLAQLDYRTGKFEKALERMNEIIPEVERYYPNQQIHANVMKVKGIVFINMGNYDSTVYYYKRSLEIANGIPDFPQRPLGFTLNNLGHIYSVLGQYDLSREYHNRALELRKRIHNNKPHMDVAQSYLNFGNIEYFTGNIDTALSYWDNVVDITESTKSANLSYSSMALSNLGEVYKEQGELEKALKYTSKSLKVKRAYYGENHTRTANSYATYASALLELNRTEEAIENFEKSISIKIASVGTKHPDLAEIFNNYGRLFLSKGEHKKAVEYFQKSLIANVPAFEDSVDVNSTPDVGAYLSPIILMDSYELKLSVAKKSPDLVSHDFIERHLNSADQFIKAIRINTTTASDQIQLGERFSQIYEYGLEHAINKYALNPSIEVAEKAFEFFEKNKSIALNFSLKENDARNYLDMPAGLIKELDSIRRMIESTQTYLLSHKEDDSTNTALFNFKRQYENQIADVENDHPNYYAYKYDLSTPTISDVQNSFSSQSDGLVEYFFGDSTLYVALVASSNQYFLKIPTSDSLYNAIINLRKTITNQEESFFEISRALYKQIFQPIDELATREEIINLTIINDGILNMLPFELLNNGDDYLLNRYTIRYANSMSLMLRNAENRQKSSNLISFAPIFEGNSDQANRDVIRGELGSLPGAVEEATSVSIFFNGKSIIEKEATETSFRSQAHEFGVIHLATHAIIDDNNPDNSKLVFSSEDSLNNDGYLHAYEIYNLDLNAQLITLSACNTGFGKIKKGEGVMSLSRAFAYAGVPSTVVSLWPASDKSTPELMKFFYQNLKDGQAKDAALNSARKQYLETATGKARHPFYWGGFVLIGDNKPLDSGSNMLIWMMPIAIVMIVAAGVYRRKKKKV
ncbi:MAG: CHAT domain-containing tetratricopeptide repeat protein [Cyclobacteriaceae bacterium]